MMGKVQEPSNSEEYVKFIHIQLTEVTKLFNVGLMEGKKVMTEVHKSSPDTLLDR
jgi:hypothetical protein